MAVQYNSENNNWETWIDLFKNKIPEASDEAKKALDDIQKNLSKGFILDSYDEFIKSNNLADESLINFLKDANYGTKDLANYQQYLKDTGKATSTFTSFTQKAGYVLKSFGATLASIGINWAKYIFVYRRGTVIHTT